MKKINRKNRVVRAALSGLEALEGRMLMAAPGPLGGPVPEDIAGKIDQRLYDVSLEVQRGGTNAWMRDGVVHVDTAGRIQTYVMGDPTELGASLRNLGALVDGSDRVSQLTEAWLPADKFDDIARLGAVRQIEVPAYATFNTVTSQGDSVHKADKVRSQFAQYGIDGTGIKVGVISDGAGHIADVGAELPSVTIDPSHPGSGNEGTAMMEIVHDLAPGAQLYFSGVGNGTAFGMSQSINWLVSQGCNVIVDDVTFFDQGFFSDTLLANTAQNAINQGVVYVTAAGNQADHGHWQGQFTTSQSLGKGGMLNKFGAFDDDNKVNIPAGANFRSFLEWSDAWGASSNDYNLYLFNSDTFAQLDASEKLQTGSQNPWEMVNWTNNTGSTVHAELWVVRKTGAASRELELFTVGNSTLQYSTPGDALIGQAAVPGVMSVAAVESSFPATVENFSSRGGSTIYTNFLFQTKTVRQTLDGAAVDGVQTKVGQLGYFYNPFYGTSAAAPHAAAIAALVRQANASLTPAQVSQIMADTARDISAPGYDTDSGAGRYDALAAVYAAFTPGAPDMTAVTDYGFSHTDNLTGDVTPNFTGTVPLGSYVRLFVDGVQSSAVQLAANVGTYSLFPGSNLADGQHAITIRVAADSSAPLAENSNVSAPLNVTIDTVAPALLNVAYCFDAPGQRLTYTFSEDISNGLSEGAIGVFNLTTNQYVLDSLSFAPGFKAVITFPSYTYGAVPDGNYHATITGLADSAGNILVSGLDYDYFVLAGDTNHDRSVDFYDMVAVAQSYGQSGGKLWADGDFTADGNVDFADLVILAQNYGQSLPDPNAFAPVPAQQMAVFASSPNLLDGSVKVKKSLFSTAVIRPDVHKNRRRGH
jgi:hypothetical protein